MNKNFSEEIIEIDGKEYTLFVNRAGVTNWEKATKLKEKSKEYEKKYMNNNQDDNYEFSDEINPLEGDFEDLDEDEKVLIDVYRKFYWMALYQNHKLSIKDASDLFDKALEEYGIEQLAELAQQILENINSNNNQNLKNLKALKSTK